MSVWIGIDPGQEGAAAMFQQHDVVDIYDYKDVVTAARFLDFTARTLHVRLVAIERQTAMPKQGVSSTLKIGIRYGEWRGILAALSLPFIEVRAREWKRGIVRPGADKKEILAVARQMFPAADLSLAKHHHRAEALLLAWHAKQKWQGGKP